ncbi:CBS domain-containing protein [Kitasatospora cineracea]|uniref:CBS domain-containing protein n=1 Tax=Kitasatospora cineracea TaxID=88074 RepID=UPI0037ADB82A
MRLTTLMSAPAVTVAPDAPLPEAARLMADADVGCLPVVAADGRLLGVVTDRDLALRRAAPGGDPHPGVAAVMSAPAVTVDADGTVDDAYRLFRRTGVRRLPVVRDGRPVGVLSVDDLLIDALRRFADLLGPVSGSVLHGDGGHGSRSPAPPAPTADSPVVGDVMGRALVAVGADAPFREVADLLRHWRTGSVPVLAGDGRVVGVVSEADLLRARDDRAAGDPAHLTARRLMTAPAFVVHPDTALPDAARLVVDRRLHRLPVVDAEDRLVGSVHRRDLLAAAGRDAADLADRVRFALLAAVHPGAFSRLSVRADGGRVVLDGWLPRGLTAAEAARLVRAVPGVDAVDVTARPDAAAPTAEHGGER